MANKGSGFYSIVAELKRRDMLESQVPKVVGQNTMYFLKLKSNSLRNTGLIVDNVLLTFDGDGVAYFKPTDMPAIATYMAARPGRLTLLENDVVEPVVQEMVPVVEEDALTSELKEALAQEDDVDEVSNTEEEVFEDKPTKRGRPSKKGK